MIKLSKDQLSPGNQAGSFAGWSAFEAQYFNQPAHAVTDYGNFQLNGKDAMSQSLDARETRGFNTLLPDAAPSEASQFRFMFSLYSADYIAKNTHSGFRFALRSGIDMHGSNFIVRGRADSSSQPHLEFKTDIVPPIAGYGDGTRDIPAPSYLLQPPDSDAPVMVTVVVECNVLATHRAGGIKRYEEIFHAFVWQGGEPVVPPQWVPQRREIEVPESYAVDFTRTGIQIVKQFHQNNFLGTPEDFDWTAEFTNVKAAWSARPRAKTLDTAGPSGARKVKVSVSHPDVIKLDNVERFINKPFLDYNDVAAGGLTMRNSPRLPPGAADLPVVYTSNGALPYAREGEPAYNAGFPNGAAKTYAGQPRRCNTATRDGGSSPGRFYLSPLDFTIFATDSGNIDSRAALVMKRQGDSPGASRYVNIQYNDLLGKFRESLELLTPEQKSGASSQHDSWSFRSYKIADDTNQGGSRYPYPTIPVIELDQYDDPKKVTADSITILFDLGDMYRQHLTPSGEVVSETLIAENAWVEAIVPIDLGWEAAPRGAGTPGSGSVASGGGGGATGAGAAPAPSSGGGGGGAIAPSTPDVSSAPDVSTLLDGLEALLPIDIEWGGAIEPILPNISTLFDGLEPPSSPEGLVQFAAQVVAETTSSPVSKEMFGVMTSAVSALGPTAYKASKFAVLANSGDVLAAADALADLQTYIDLELEPGKAEEMFAALAPLKDQFLAGGYLDEFGEFKHTPQSMDAEAAQPGFVAREQFLPNDPVGFSDPGKQFPKDSNVGEPDTSRLSRKERARASALGKKELSRHQGVKTANQTGTWDQPQSAYNAQYPYNHVTQSESGHLFEMDDTPGSERVHLYHRSGTFFEVDNTGTRVRRTVGNDYTIIERDGKVHIIGNADVTIGGAHRVRVESTYDLEVHGATNINIFNDAKVRISGNADLKVSGNLTAGVIGNTSVSTMGKMSLTSNGDMNIGTRGALNIHAVEGVSIKSSADVMVAADGEVHIGTTGSICLDGKSTYLQSGYAEPGTASVGELKMDKDLMFKPNKTVLPPLAPFNRAEESAAVFETPDEGDDSQVAAWKQQRINEGTTTAAQVNAPAKVKDTGSAGGGGGTTANVSDTGSAGSGTAPAGTAQVTVPSGREFRADDKISKYFTLGDVTHRYSRKLTDRFGNTAADKFKALSYLATNALDVIKAKFPSMVINSGLRDFIPPGGAKKSQHLTGHAVDISFPGLDRKGHFERAKELSKLVPFDQMLLEYNTPGGNGWIHVSLTTSPRQQAFTMNNHRKVSANGQFAYIAAK